MLIRAVVGDLRGQIPPAVIAARFHNAVADSTVAICSSIRERRSLHQVVLGGGVFQNAILVKRLRRQLGAAGFDVYVPEKLPPNDGGISFGQAAVAAARMRTRIGNQPTPEQAKGAPQCVSELQVRSSRPTA